LDNPRLYFASTKNCFDISYKSPKSAPKLKDLVPCSVSNRNQNEVRQKDEISQINQFQLIQELGFDLSL
jgi:hypothetical protein